MATTCDTILAISTRACVIPMLLQLQLLAMDSAQHRLIDCGRACQDTSNIDTVSIKAPHRNSQCTCTPQAPLY